ncbi:MAG TPA: Ig-like domain-containing protein [Trueperaceae bacterium]|nr:Ig-like domain-containing protein [Trueperaceae bacterium]
MASCVWLALLSLLLALSSCSGPQGPIADLAITGLEATTYVNGPITFTVLVIGGRPDSIELRRDGALFQQLSGNAYTWDSSSAPEGSYVFVARARRGEQVVDSEPKTVVVDRTAPTVTFSATPSAAPLILPGGTVALAATATDDIEVARVEFLDGDVVVDAIATEPYAVDLDAIQGVHQYRARAVDRAGNATVSTTETVAVYQRQTVTLESEAALDGCIEAGYDPSLFVRYFSGPSCTWITSYSILHLFSFDRADYLDAAVEEATLRFELREVSTFTVSVAGVDYGTSGEAPPTAFVYPFVSTVPETGRTLSNQTYGFSMPQELDVTDLAQAAVADERARWQFRIRTMGSSASGLGGTVYFSEQGAPLRPTLVLKLLVP